MPKLPPDATKTAIAETVALRAVVFARVQRDGLVTRLLVEEAASVVFTSARYADVPHPAMQTVFQAVRRIARDADDLTVRLNVTDPENRIPAAPEPTTPEPVERVPATLDGHTRTATTRTDLLDDGEYPPGFLIGDCSCGDIYIVAAGGIDEFDALEREHARHVGRVRSVRADATCVDGRAVDVVDGEHPGGGSYASCPSCKYRGPTGNHVYACGDAFRHNADATTRAAALPDAACETCGGPLDEEDRIKCQGCVEATECSECAADVGTVEIGRNGGMCDDCADTVESDDERFLS